MTGGAFLRLKTELIYTFTFKKAPGGNFEWDEGC
jgi:hypothetical protein